MAATALIKFTQGPNTAAAGIAVLGTLTDGSVTITNGNNTDVASWKIYLLDAPPDSALYALGAQPQVLAEASDNSPTHSMAVDVAGSYRCMLEVRDAGGTLDRDIRVFGIPDRHGFVRPPYQKNPDPLPVALPGIITEDPRPYKPDEQNYGVNPRGWAGDGVSGQLEQFFRQYDYSIFQVFATTPITLTVTSKPHAIVDLPTIAGVAQLTLPTAPPAGYTQRVSALGPKDNTQVLTIVPGVGGSINTLSTLKMLGGGSVDLVHRGSNVWSVIGGKYNIYERTIVGGVQNTDLTGWTAIGAATFNPSDLLNYSGGLVPFLAICHTTDAADAAEIRLFNITTASAVVGSNLVFTETIPTQKSANLTLPAGANMYEAQLRLQTTGSPNRAFCSQAQFIIDWFQV